MTSGESVAEIRNRAETGAYITIEEARSDVVRLLDALQRADSRYETCLADYKHAVRSLEKAESELARVSEVLIQRLADLRALRDEYERVVAALRELAEEKRQVGAGWFIARARAVLAGLQDEHSSDPRCCPEYDEQRIMEHLDGFRVIIDGLAESIRDEDAFKAHMFDAIAWNCRAHGLFGAFGWKMRARAAEAELAELRVAVPSDAEPELPSVADVAGILEGREMDSWGAVPSEEQGEPQ